MSAELRRMKKTIKMFKVILMLCLKTVLLESAPLHPMQQIMPLNQFGPVVQTNALQEQLLALQKLQNLHMLNTLHSPSVLYVPPTPPQPIVVILPNVMKDLDMLKQLNNVKSKHANKEQITDDSIIVDAADSSGKEQNVPSAIILIPNRRFSIGEVISGISWLPLEVNVPDTIRWIYNSIAEIIAGIGQRIPFRPRPQSTESPVASEVSKEDANLVLKQYWRREEMKENSMMPIVVVPINGMPLGL